MQPELRELRAFLAVADQGSANRAGAALFRAQSAVSRSIHKLERELGVNLFERRARGMLITEYGRALLLRARRVQAELQRARTELAALAGKGSIRNAPIFGMLAPERRVRAFIALTEQHHMPSVADSLGITQPAVSIAVREMEESIGAELFERTARGMIPTPAGAALALRLKRALAEIRHAIADVAALRGITQGTVTVGALRPPEYASDLEGAALADDELAIVTRRDHPWAKRKRIAPEHLARAGWVLPRDNTPNRMLFERALAKRGLPAPNVVVETSDLAVLRGVLLTTDLLTAISPHQLYYELASRLLAVLPFPLPETRRVIGITRRTDSVASPGAKLLMEEIARRVPTVLALVAPDEVAAEAIAV